VDGLIFARDRVAMGESPSVLERHLKRGELTRIRRGTYVSSERWQTADSVARHRLSMQAIVDHGDADAVFSHQSAAIIWGIPIIGELPASPHLMFPAERGITRRAGAICHHRASIERAEREGFAVTSFRQTVLDLVAVLPATHGVPVLDFALSEAAPQQLDRPEIARWLAGARPFRGARRIDTALGIATGLAQSPLESLSLVRFAEFGIPRPRQQLEIDTEAGAYWVDFYWPHADAVGEADGRGKYRTPEDLWKEKRREDAIRARVKAFVRWSWSDISKPELVPARLRKFGV
jgi:hypothetical protein